MDYVVTFSRVLWIWIADRILIAVNLVKGKIEELGVSKC